MQEELKDCFYNTPAQCKKNLRIASNTPAQYKENSSTASNSPGKLLNFFLHITRRKHFLFKMEHVSGAPVNNSFKHTLVNLIRHTNLHY